MRITQEQINNLSPKERRQLTPFYLAQQPSTLTQLPKKELRAMSPVYKLTGQVTITGLCEEVGLDYEAEVERLEAVVAEEEASQERARFRCEQHLEFIRVAEETQHLIREVEL